MSNNLFVGNLQRGLRLLFLLSGLIITFVASSHAMDRPDRAGLCESDDDEQEGESAISIEVENAMKKGALCLIKNEQYRCMFEYLKKHSRTSLFADMMFVIEESQSDSFLTLFKEVMQDDGGGLSMRSPEDLFSRVAGLERLVCCYSGLDFNAVIKALQKFNGASLDRLYLFRPEGYAAIMPLQQVAEYFPNLAEAGAYPFSLKQFIRLGEAARGEADLWHRKVLEGIEQRLVWEHHEVRRPKILRADCIEELQILYKGHDTSNDASNEGDLEFARLEEERRAFCMKQLEESLERLKLCCEGGEADCLERLNPDQDDLSDSSDEALELVREEQRNVSSSQSGAFCGRYTGSYLLFVVLGSLVMAFLCMQ